MDNQPDFEQLSDEERDELAELTRKVALAIMMFFEIRDMPTDAIGEMGIQFGTKLANMREHPVAVERQSLINVVRNAMLFFRRQNGGDPGHCSVQETMRLIAMIDRETQKIARDQRDRLWYDGAWNAIKTAMSVTSHAFIFACTSARS